MKNLVKCVVAVLLAAGMVSAATVWNPAANGIYPPDTGDWNDPANWTNGVPSETSPSDKAVFNVPGAAECIVSDAQTVGHLVQGDNNDGGILRIVDGGFLKAGTNPVWTAIGYNNPAHCIVETGGELTAAQHLWVGLLDGAEGTLDLEGGTVNVANMIGIGWDGGIGQVNVNAGLFNLGNWNATDSIKAGSNMNITEGTVRINGHRIDSIETMVGDGRITGYGFSDLDHVQVAWDAEAQQTVITAIPEPVTLTLLGLGGLLLRKRR